MDTFLSFAIPICTILLGLSAFFDSWAKYNQREIFEGRPRINTAFLSNTGFKVFYFIFLTVLSLYLSKCNSDMAEKKSKTETALRESAHQKHDDSLQLEYKKDIRITNDSNIHSFSNSLLQYNLAYNEQQKKVYSLLRDSINTDKPSLSISPGMRRMKPSKDTFFISFNFQNSGNCPITVNSQIYSATWYSNERIFLSDNKNGLKSRSIGTYDVVGVPQELYITTVPNKIYFLILGSYTNENGNIKHRIDNLFEWETNTLSVGIPTDILLKDSIERNLKKYIFHRSKVQK